MKYVFELENGKQIIGYGDSYSPALKDAWSRTNENESLEVVDFYTVK